MRELKKFYSEDRPNKIIDLGTGYWYYNYNIQQEENGYSYYQVRISGKPDYKECVKQVIRLYISQEEEFDIINSANTYLLGMIEDEAKVDEYKQYLELVQQIKQLVKEDFKDS